MPNSVLGAQLCPWCWEDGSELESEPCLHGADILQGKTIWHLVHLQKGTISSSTQASFTLRAAGGVAWSGPWALSTGLRQLVIPPGI